MADEKPKIMCASHGERFSTFICKHLLGAKDVAWYSGEPSPENPWPSAWCEQCHQAFLTEGEWNERSNSAANLEIVAVCHSCYESFKIRCVPHGIDMEH